jgi:hypothetical protein
MRHHLVIAGLLLLGACGGDSDVTNPPEDGNFTLTVTGPGTGSGRVETDESVTPAIDCTLAGGATPSGVCSGSYPAGTVVGITVIPASGSAFDGWGGDASSCGTTLSCSITMDANKSAAAQLSAGSSSDLQITSSAWYPQPASDSVSGTVNWIAEVRNTTSRVVETAQIDFVSRDAAGNELASDFSFVGPIPPGETRANESFAEYVGTEASVDIRVGAVTFAAEDPGLAVAQIVSSNWRVDPALGEAGAIVWTVDVQNTTSDQLEAVQVDFVTYDAAGKVLEYDFTIVGPIPPGATQASEGLADLHGTEASVNYQVASVTHDDLVVRR